MQPIHVLVVDPSSSARARLSEALGNRFVVHTVHDRFRAAEVLKQDPAIRLILVSSQQLEWKGKQLARHLRKKVKVPGPLIWHYGEVDGTSKVSDVMVKDYQRQYGIDRFLSATLAPIEIARSVAAQFRDELVVVEREQRQASFDELSFPLEVKTARKREGDSWDDLLHSEVSVHVIRRALTKDLVTPVDTLSTEHAWSDTLRARVSLHNLWHVLNKDLVLAPVEIQRPVTVRQVLLARVSFRNVKVLLGGQARAAA